jgi:alpha-galactosidase/6-phospho-beta-glucosidase family protein
VVRQLQGMYLNEYLHYFYHRDEALKSLLAKPETRGEEVVKLTAELLERLRESNPKANPDKALSVYHEVMDKRGATYMAHAREGKPRPQSETADDDEGYAGVALGCIQAIATNTPQFTGLNVPNNGAIDGLQDDDVVEISCTIDASGIYPIRIGAMPEGQYLLTRTIKRYERLASQAILNRSKITAVEALATHPLIGSYPLAEKLVDAFVEAHHEWVGDWN